MSKKFKQYYKYCTLVMLPITFKVFSNDVSPEKMIFDLNEEAMCIASADNLKHTSLAKHQTNFDTLVKEYEVPVEDAKNILKVTNSEYEDFIRRAKKRYDKEILPSMLLSAYTHRCMFMNGFEARKDFNAEPPQI